VSKKFARWRAQRVTTVKNPKISFFFSINQNDKTATTMSYSANDNQNIFVRDGKTTSRVLSQPGGASSLSIGTWTPEELQRSREAAEKKKAAAEAATSKFQETTYRTQRMNFCFVLL
jgi:hypothetical protein